MTIARFIAGGIFAIAGLAVGGWLLLEAVAIWRNTDATISDIINGELVAHGELGDFIIGLIAGATIMLLAGHFANVWRWWVP